MLAEGVREGEGPCSTTSDGEAAWLDTEGQRAAGQSVEHVDPELRDTANPKHTLESIPLGSTSGPLQREATGTGRVSQVVLREGR